MDDFGEKLRELVEQSPVSKKEVADALGITSAGLSSIFSSGNTKIDTVFKICGACNVKTWQFVAQVETGIPTKVWNNFEMILMLEPEDRAFVFKAINNALDLIIEREKI